jgi:small subunit ribosomal protein S24e
LDLKIVEERKNPLLKRTEYRFLMSHPTAATPKRDEVRQELASQLKVPKERIVVERMHAKFGTPMSVGEAAAYSSKDAALSTVREHILIRNGLKEKAKPAVPGAEPEAAAPAAPEKPAEKAAEKAAEKPAEKAAEKPEAKPSEPHAEKPEKPAKAAKAPKADKAEKAEKAEKAPAKEA